jgi:hypothetical protein
MSDSAIPFGLLFLEKEITRVDQSLATYDEQQDVSVLEVNGRRIPLVSAVDARMGTETFTEVAGEATDALSQEALAPWWLSTDRETKAEADYTLGALQFSLAMAAATETETRIAREETD